MTPSKTSGIRAIECQGAFVGDVAGEAAGSAAIAEPQRARRDRCAAKVSIVGRQRHHPGAGHGQGARAGDRTGEQIVEAAIVDRPAAGRQRDRTRAGDRGIGQQAAAVQGQRRAGGAEVQIGMIASVAALTIVRPVWLLMPVSVAMPPPRIVTLPVPLIAPA